MKNYNNIYSQDISQKGKLLYRYLRDRSGKKDMCWPAIKTISKDTSMSVSTVKRAMNELIIHGFLVKEHRKRENGGDTSNMYYSR